MRILRDVRTYICIHIRIGGCLELKNQDVYTMSTSSLIFPESILSHSLVPRPFVEKYDQYECFKFQFSFAVSSSQKPYSAIASYLEKYEANSASTSVSKFQFSFAVSSSQKAYSAIASYPGRLWRLTQPVRVFKIFSSVSCIWIYVQLCTCAHRRHTDVYIYRHSTH